MAISADYYFGMTYDVMGDMKLYYLGLDSKTWKVNVLDVITVKNCRYGTRILMDQSDSSKFAIAQYAFAPKVLFGHLSNGHIGLKDDLLDIRDQFGGAMLNGVKLYGFYKTKMQKVYEYDVVSKQVQTFSLNKGKFKLRAWDVRNF
jgi:hypothetical protein